MLEFYFASKLEHSPTGSFELKSFLNEMPRDLGITTVYQEDEWPAQYIWQAQHNNSHVWEKLSPKMYENIKNTLNSELMDAKQRTNTSRGKLSRTLRQALRDLGCAPPRRAMDHLAVDGASQ